MLNTLKETGKTIGRELNRAWESLSDGWRELLSRSSDALTHFKRHAPSDDSGAMGLATFPNWSLLAGELEETRTDVVLRIELPGMDKADCSIVIDGNMLHLSGEKRFERETRDSTYHVMERAYGSFQRSIPLPRNVDGAKARASFRHGVLTVRMPKTGDDTARTIPVS